MLWYTLAILMVVEIFGYGITFYVANAYRHAAWDHFNLKAREWSEVDKNVPYADMINRYARQSGVSARVVAAVIQTESSFQPRALSHHGAYGLMQIVPETWKQINGEIQACSGRHSGECGPDCYYNPELNIRIGTAYLAKMIKQQNGNIVLALACYNAGPYAVDHYGGIPPYGETRDYLEKIISYWYQVDHKGLPTYLMSAKRWDKAHGDLGRWLMLTFLVATYVGYCLVRRCRSWRWR
jgi:soluble lytic murein transglycosylase-like protein